MAHLLPAVRSEAPAFVDVVMAGLEAERGTETTAERRPAAALWRDEQGQPLEALSDVPR